MTRSRRLRLKLNFNDRFIGSERILREACCQKR